MFRSVQSHGQSSEPTIDIAPLIDVTFILLLFFLVSSTFTRDTGVSVTRPHAALTQPMEPSSLRVSVTAAGDVYTQGHRVSLDELRGKVAKFVGQSKKKTVVVIPDIEVPAGRLIEVMDIARLAGAADVAVATRRVEAGK